LSVTRDCIVFGGYAGGTVGDEIALAVAMDRVRAEHGPSFSVLTRNPAYTRGLFPGLELISYSPVGRLSATRRGSVTDFIRRLGARGGGREAYALVDQLDQQGDAPDWLDAVRRCRRLYMVGGGYFNDVWEPSYTLLPVQAAAQAGVCIETAPVQIGPYSSSKALRSMVKTLGRADVRVRDRTSLELAQAQGLEAEAAPDHVFDLLSVLPGLKRSPRGRSRPRIGVCVFRQNGAPQAAFDAWWLRCLSCLAKFTELEIWGFAFHSFAGYDHDDTVRCFARAGLDTSRVLAPPSDFMSAVETLTQFDAVLTCRFHASVAATVLGMPAFAFGAGEYYAAKLTAFWPAGVQAFTPVTLGSSPEEAAEQVAEAGSRRR
jgi:polysaccharide pyruvyl transferase WcaK-like protein